MSFEQPQHQKKTQEQPKAEREKLIAEIDRMQKDAAAREELESERDADWLANKIVTQTSFDLPKSFIGNNRDDAKKLLEELHAMASGENGFAEESVRALRITFRYLEIEKHINCDDLKREARPLYKAAALSGAKHDIAELNKKLQKPGRDFLELYYTAITARNSIDFAREEGCGPKDLQEFQAPMKDALRFSATAFVKEFAVASKSNRTAMREPLMRAKYALEEAEKLLAKEELKAVQDLFHHSLQNAAQKAIEQCRKIAKGTSQLNFNEEHTLRDTEEIIDLALKAKIQVQDIQREFKILKKETDKRKP